MLPKEIINQIAQEIIANKDYLTDLDIAIGDGDHGINMARGFESVIAKIAPLPNDISIKELLKTVGICLMATVGGAAGPLYGTAFVRVSSVIDDNISEGSIEKMFTAAINGIKDRGKADFGDKTMLDTLIPAQKIFLEAKEKGAGDLEAFHICALAAKKAAEQTKEFMARKGRASYLGARSIGHIDPGAASCAIILETIDKCLQEN